MKRSRIGDEFRSLALEVLDVFRKALVEKLTQLIGDILSGSASNLAAPGREDRQGVIQSRPQQVVMGEPNAHCDHISALAETDLTENLTRIAVLTFDMHGPDQIVRNAELAPMSVELIRTGIS